MKKFEVPHLTFEEEGHIYRMDGVEVPSVTTLMGPLKEVAYGNVDQRALVIAAARGTAVHQAIETYVEYGIRDVEHGIEGYFDAFEKWYVSHEMKVIATEEMVYHPVLRYAGTVDMLAVIDNEITLVDFKTSTKVQEYLCAVQLEAYARAIGSLGMKVDRRVIVHLQKNGEFREMPFERNAQAWSVFSALLTIRNYAEQMKK